MAGLHDGSVVVLDVRSKDDIPLRQLEQRLTDLPRKQAIVAYCRGPYCVLSFEAAVALRTHAFNVRRFEYGFPEWKPAGLPIEAAHALRAASPDRQSHRGSRNGTGSSSRAHSRPITRSVY